MKLKKRLFTKRKCQCGSRFGHLFDYHRDGHYAICNARQHEKQIDPPWAPTVFDFFCACGGLFLATKNVVVLPSGIVLCCDFECAACATRWRITAPPENNAGIALAVSIASELGEAVAAQFPDMLDDVQSLLSCSEGPTESGLKRFTRILLSRWNEPLVPPEDLPEKQRFLANVLDCADSFSRKSCKNWRKGSSCGVRQAKNLECEFRQLRQGNPRGYLCEPAQGKPCCRRGLHL